MTQVSSQVSPIVSYLILGPTPSPRNIWRIIPKLSTKTPYGLVLPYFKAFLDIIAKIFIRELRYGNSSKSN